MGTLRFLLAISVAYDHFGSPWGIRLIPGLTAVQCFFIVSGFYMSLVLNGKYQDTSYGLFISNRLFRLYPVYLTVLIATLLLLEFPVPNLDPLGWAFFIVSQVTLLAQDAEMFLTIKNGALAFTQNFSETSPNLFDYAPVPQAWSLGVEMWFYLLAPFILKRSTKFIVGLLLASVIIRVGSFFVFGLSYGAWPYRFFPFEIALFLLGALAHRSMVKQFDVRQLAALSLLMAAALLLQLHSGLGRLVSVSFLAAVAIVIPWLFEKTKDLKFDRMVGELSYPIYLVHVLVGDLISDKMLAMVFVLTSSAALYFLIDRPVDKWRQGRLTAKGSIRGLADLPNPNV